MVDVIHVLVDVIHVLVDVIHVLVDVIVSVCILIRLCKPHDIGAIGWLGLFAARHKTMA